MEGKRDSFFLSHKKGNKTAGKEQFKKRDNQTNNKQETKQKRFNNFNKNRVGVEDNQNHEENTEKTEKKPFDKKAYRLKKYSKKYKLEQWEEQRKKKLVRDYQKTMKNDPMAGSYKPISFDEDTTDSNDVGKFVRHPDLLEEANEEGKPKNKDPFQKAKDQYNKVKQDKLQKQQQIEEAKENRRLKIQEYKKNKQDRFKKLSKKNKKGQPDMGGRMELLLEKIQKG